jgi:hypothetical protein
MLTLGVTNDILTLVSRVDYPDLQKRIRRMKRWHKLYKFLKDELTRLGYWKLKSRGNPSKGFQTGLGKNKEKL